MKKKSAAPPARGFTLLELLMALAVTAMVVALVFAGFGLIGRSEERSQALLDRAERILLVSQWLARKFDSLRPLSRLHNGTVTPFFSGNPAGAMWVAPLPERGDAGGLHVFRLGPLRHPDGSIDLLVEALPFDGALMQLDWSQALRQTLLTDARSLQWYYQEGSTGQWDRQWGKQGHFPVRVKVEIGDARGDWPPLIFALPGAR
ncbi:prepilin-type N-terminal cleavage/methylation domain-containing protein [Ottowia testudinis]|uniref:Prepilin-type N-terminal cleavage/methylation domain-containing protein n=1 Tax=Ottowia testudinis TaxID=2816950 RepID=A0A975H2N6_9BURK|nr:prepilin-type N-terminal cleavage/methylation domain-containing protein [Ottowia testudinis]QTD45048.1 prepilin-type N-terminal cleavage/methylation domain-containing protein [Ottowia testudinis]